MRPRPGCCVLTVLLYLFWHILLWNVFELNYGFMSGGCLRDYFWQWFNEYTAAIICISSIMGHVCLALVWKFWLLQGNLMIFVTVTSVLHVHCEFTENILEMKVYCS